MSNRFVKMFKPEEDVLKNVKKYVSDAYIYIKRNAYYKDTENHKRGTLIITHRKLAKELGMTIFKTQSALAELIKLGLLKTKNINTTSRSCTTSRSNKKPKIENADNHLDSSSRSCTTSRSCTDKQKIVGTLITICYYDVCKDSDWLFLQKQVAKTSKNSEKQVAPMYSINNIYIDRKINIPPDIFSNEKMILPPKGAKKNFEDGGLYSEEKKSKKMETENNNFEFSQKDEILKNFEIFKIELENLKKENENLKNELINLKKIFRGDLSLNATLNTKKEKEKNGAQKEKEQNTAVLSEDFPQNDKFIQLDNKIATAGLKTAKSGNSQKFVPPTLQEIQEYCEKRRNGIDAEMFFDFYESKGWVVGRTKMKSWQACVRTWEKKNNYSKEKASKKNRNDWNGDDETRFKENLKIVTNSEQWRTFSKQAYKDFDLSDKLNYYNEFILKFANDKSYSDIFYDDEMQAKLKQHFIDFLNVKLRKLKEFKEKYKPKEKTLMQKTAEVLIAQGYLKPHSMYDSLKHKESDNTYLK